MIKYILFNFLRIQSRIYNRTETGYKTRETRVNYEQESKPKPFFHMLKKPYQNPKLTSKDFVRWLTFYFISKLITEMTLLLMVRHFQHYSLLNLYFFPR